MSRIVSFLLIILAFSAEGHVLVIAYAQRCDLDIALVLDSSGSMNDVISGQRKADVLKEAVQSFIRSAPTSSIWAISVLEFRDEVYVRAPLTLVQSPGDRDRIAGTITGTGEEGTNIAKAITTAAGILTQSSRTARKLMILVSDGEPEVYTKVPDYRARTEALDAAQSAKNSGVLILTVGIGLTDETSDIMQRIATNTNYFVNAPSSSAINEWFNSRSGDICLAAGLLPPRSTKLIGGVIAGTIAGLLAKVAARGIVGPTGAGLVGWWTKGPTAFFIPALAGSFAATLTGILLEDNAGKCLGSICVPSDSNSQFLVSTLVGVAVTIAVGAFFGTAAVSIPVFLAGMAISYFLSQAK
jgi:uncharacterized protein YegL